MIHYLRYCCAMFFALISFLLAPPQRAQAQNREAYVAQSADKTTLTFYYDDQRATRTGKSWGIEETRDYTLPAWAGTYQVPDSTTTRVVFEASFRNFRPTSTALWFYKCSALEQIEGFQYLNTSEVKDMSGMFSDCSGLTSLDLSHFNTQNVTSMDGMFDGCSGLTSLDLSHFNTQNVTSMDGMFNGCSGLTSLDLSHFNTQNVTDMRAMFLYCSGLTSLDVSHFNTQNVTDMRAMFYECSALATISSNTAWQCPQSKEMFDGCTKLKGAVPYDQNKTDVTMANPETGYFTRSNDGGVEAYVAQSADKTTLTFYYDDQRATRTGTTWGIEETKKERGYTFPAWAGTWKVADSVTTHVVFDGSFRDFRPTTTTWWFLNYRALKQIEGLEYLNTLEVKDMSGMFDGCSGLTSLDVSHFNTQNVIGMYGMFLDCSGLTSLDLSHFNTQNVTDMGGMFWGCSGLTSLDLSHFNTQNVIYMYGMFRGCSGLTSLDLSHFNTQNVTGMNGMFWDCSGLTSLDVSNFNTQNVTGMSSMFAGCSVLPSLDLSHFNTQNVTDMWAMFSGCSGLTSLDVKNFNTQNVTSMGGMFGGCSGLTSLDLSHFNTQNVTTMMSMFSGCSGLTSLDLSHFNTQKVTDMSRMFSDCSALATISSNTAWQCPQSEKMFAGCTKLKGAVPYDQNKTDVTMANPETGYFTRSNDGGVEAYVAQSADKTTLTFYYDDQRATRTGTTWGFEKTKVDEFKYTYFPWTGTVLTPDETATHVVFDSSFRDFHPTSTAYLFFNCRALEQIEGLEYLNTSEVTDMSSMFNECVRLTSLNVKNFNTHKVKDMSGMFLLCSVLTSLDLSHFNTQNVTNMNGMFAVCSGLTSLDLSHFNTQNVTGMNEMFSSCSGLTSLDVSHFNTQNVTGMNGMFRGCSGLTSLDVSHFNTQNVTNMYEMFKGCSGLTSLDVSHFNTQNITDMFSMFSGCSGLTSLDLKNFNTQNVTDMGGMFSGCSGLTSLDLSHFNTQNVTHMDEMFSGCSALTTINSNTTWLCQESKDMFAGCTKLKGAVAYDGKKTDAKMANPETGYFTAKPTTVESVRFGADDAQHIYTLQGKRVRGAWKHLPAGVYVVNGKKTVKP